MVDFEKLHEMDNIIAGLEIASENVRYMIQDLEDEFFSLPGQRDRECCFARGQVKNRMALDYISEAKKLLERLVPIFNAVFEETRAEYSGNKNSVLTDTGEKVRLTQKGKTPDSSQTDTPIIVYKNGILRLLRQLWKSEDVHIWRAVYTFVKVYAEKERVKEDVK